MGWLKKLFGSAPEPAEPAAQLPFELVVLPGAEAQAARDRMQAEADGRYCAVILGGEDDVAATAEVFRECAQTPEEILYAVRNWTPRAVVDALQAGLEGEEPPVGQWPEPDAVEPLAPMSHLDPEMLKPLPEAIIARVPCPEPWMAPAFLRFGDWNACPPADQHVVLLRDWHLRFGAEVTAMTADTIECRVARRPDSRDEALGLAREVHAYCPDLLDVIYGDLSTLAATLMVSDIWRFWWDADDEEWVP